VPVAWCAWKSRHIASVALHFSFVPSPAPTRADPLWTSMEVQSVLTFGHDAAADHEAQAD
jgi:hypothetical protein